MAAKDGEGRQVKGDRKVVIQRAKRLANPPEVERVYDPDRGAMVAALRLTLRLQGPSPKTGQETRQ
jgi:hypothetical protein